MPSGLRSATLNRQAVATSMCTSVQAPWPAAPTQLGLACPYKPHIVAHQGSAPLVLHAPWLLASPQPCGLGGHAKPRHRYQLPPRCTAAMMPPRSDKLVRSTALPIKSCCVQVHIPREGVTVAFSPSGIRCPSRAATADPASGRSAAAGEPYAEEAMAFTRAQCLQRDVEIEVCKAHCICTRGKAGAELCICCIPCWERLHRLSRGTQGHARCSTCSACVRRC